MTEVTSMPDAPESHSQHHEMGGGIWGPVRWLRSEEHLLVLLQRILIAPAHIQ